MAIRDKTRRMVVIPLAVMLLLTVIVGFSAYSLSHKWDAALHRLAGRVAEAVILNNIRWELVQVSQTIQTSPHSARASWEKARQYMALLPPDRRPAVLQTLFNDETNIKKVSYYLGQDVLRVNLDWIENDLMATLRYARDVNLMMTFSMIILGVVLMGMTARDLNRLMNELRQSRDLNVTIQEEERRRLAQDLHDGVIQELVGLKRDYAPEKVDALVDVIRRVCHNLKPQVLEDLGLAAAIEFLADELRRDVPTVEVHLDTAELAKLPKEYELPIFRVAQEIFSNIRQHARATQVSVSIVYHPEESPTLRLYARDNGVGFDVKHPPRKGLGLTGIEERVRQMEGRITMESEPGKGSQFRIILPITSMAPLPAAPSIESTSA